MGTSNPATRVRVNLERLLRCSEKLGNELSGELPVASLEYMTSGDGTLAFLDLSGNGDGLEWRDDTYDALFEHCRDRLLAMKRDEHRKALIAQCEEDEAASESDARRDEGESSASRIEL